MKKPWKVLSTAALVAALTISMVAPAFATNGDIVDKSTSTVYSAAQYNTNTATLNTLIDKIIGETSSNMFTYEYAGANYKFDDYSAEVTRLINAGSTATAAKTAAAGDASLLDTPVVTGLAVASVSAINTTSVDVVLPAVTEAVEEFTIEVKDPAGNVIAVVPINLLVGDTEVTFTFTTTLTAAPTGVWTVGGVQFDIAANAAAVKAVNVATTQYALWTALQNPLFNGVAVEANIVAYETAMITVVPAYVTVADIIAVVEGINEAATTEAPYAAVVEALNEAYPNQLTINTILAANFKAVNAANTAEYVVVLFNDVLPTMAAVQDAIYLINAEQSVVVALAANTALAVDGNATQADIDAVQALHDAAKTLVDALVPANAAEAVKLTTVQSNIDAAQDALDAMNVAIEAADVALAAHIAAGGTDADTEYVDLVAELDKAVKDTAPITTNTATLVAATTALTAVADAEAAQAAYLAAGGVGADTDLVYTTVGAAITTYEGVEDSINLTALQTATTNLEEATRKLVVYAGVMAATTAEMRTLLFEFDNTKYLNLSSTTKDEFAGRFVDELDAETTAPVDYAAVSALLEAKITAYKTLISDVNAATDISTMITALGNLGNDAFDVLITAQKATVAGAVLAGIPNYKTLAEIEAVIAQ